MAIVTVMKNIFSFANILQQASTKNIAHWNNENISNAFKWAYYCEHIHRQTKGKSYWNDLNDKINALTEYVQQQGARNIKITLDSLAYASFLLKQVLVGNEHTPEYVFYDILFQRDEESTCDSHTDCVDPEFQRCVEVIESNGMHNVVQEFLALQTSEKILQATRTDLVDKARKVLEYLCTLNEHTTELCRADYSHILDQVLGRVTLLPDGWAIILRASLAECRMEISHVVRDEIMTWVCRKAPGTEWLFCQLWRQDDALLRDVASHYSLFRTHYTNYLLTWAEGMLVHYRSHGPLPRYDWRHSSGNDIEFSYPQLIQHLRQVCAQPWGRRDIPAYISVNGSLKRPPNIWRDILSRLELSS